MFTNNDLHHAYLIEGEPEALVAEVLKLLVRELNYAIHANPDFWQGSFETFGIDEARDLSSRQLKKSVLGGKKVFIITFNSMTREAQNALLKVFEEPTVDTHFFLVTNSTATLLPTLLSRMCIVGKQVADGDTEAGVKFVKASPADRMKQIKKMVDADITKAEAFAFLTQVEKILHSSLASKNAANAMEEVLKVKSYLQDTSPSIKMLLEHIALVMPKQ